ERFLKSISVSINSDNFDTQQFDQQIRFFINLIKQDRLRIRKTYNPNHAKLYLFKIEDDLKLIRESIFITGSSNLTASGISYQDEFNVEISDYGTEDAEKYFDMLWDEAVKITEFPEFRHKFIRFLEEKTFIAEVTPFEAYALILKNYIDAQRQKRLKPSLQDLLIRKGYKPYKYQLDAVGQALTIIDNYNGVIISDVVGLGKSIIASLVARNIGKRGVIICPPGLIGDENKKTGWQKYKEDFGLYDWEIRSLGIENLQKTLELVRDNEEYEIVIIDEAHRFRNQDTQAYKTLSDICRSKIVILLTATPFNNTPADIFSLLKLFIIPGKSNITLDNDLDVKFREYNRIFNDLSYVKKNHNSPDPKKRQKACSKYEGLFGSKDIDFRKVRARSRILSNNIRSVIEPIMIRRNRIDLKKDPEYSKEVYELSEVKDPCELFFELSEKQADFYDLVISSYFGENGRFTGAIYRPFSYEAELKDEEKIEGARENFEYISQANLFDFMRRLIVKRFESSFGAFEQSINNFESITKKVIEFIN
ncbi:helicase, partial [Candidatus Poribacteria bacterium]|nr:helicase [Candidatus Poribacteria bacterium]